MDILSCIEYILCNDLDLDFSLLKLYKKEREMLRNA